MAELSEDDRNLYKELTRGFVFDAGDTPSSEWVHSDNVKTLLHEIRRLRQVEKAYENDERIPAWHKVVEHPFFKRAFEIQGPLINGMITLLDFEMDRTDQTVEAEKDVDSAEPATIPLDDLRLREMAMDFATRPPLSPTATTTGIIEGAGEILAFLKGELPAAPLAPEETLKLVDTARREAYQQVQQFFEDRGYPNKADMVRIHFLKEN